MMKRIRDFFSNVWDILDDLFITLPYDHPELAIIVPVVSVVISFAALIIVLVLR